MQMNRLILLASLFVLPSHSVVAQGAGSLPPPVPLPAPPPSAYPAPDAAPAREPGLGERAGAAVDRAAGQTGQALERAAEESGSAVGRALRWSGQQMQGAGEWTARQGERMTGTPPAQPAAPSSR
jgi:hypothetical protein